MATSLCVSFDHTKLLFQPWPLLFVSYFPYVKGYSKKVYFDLDQLEKCGFLHAIQLVAINTFKIIVFLNDRNLDIFAVFHGNFWSKKFSSL